MDPVTAFATIVSLVATFKSERQGQESADFEQFVQWMLSNNHQEMKQLLETNTKATISIKALLNKTTKELEPLFEQLDSTLAALASGIDELRDLSEAFHPESQLSPQALSFLEQFEDREATGLLKADAMGRDPIYLFTDGDKSKGGTLEVVESRFAEDDLNTLADLGLLRIDYNSKGSPVYKFTRAASDLVKARRIT